MSEKRFQSTVMCNGLGEFEYIIIKDRRWSNNHLTYYISSDRDLDYLLNSLNDDILDLRSKRKPLWCKIKERIWGCSE